MDDWQKMRTLRSGNVTPLLSKLQAILEQIEKEKLPIVLVNRPGETAKEFYSIARYQFPAALKALIKAMGALKRGTESGGLFWREIALEEIEKCFEE